jgi:hypothetical protein
MSHQLELTRFYFSVILSIRHPDGRQASARRYQRASRPEGPCVSFRGSTGFARAALELIVLCSDDQNN